MTNTLLFVGGYAPPTDVGIRVFDATDPLADPIELAQMRGIENPSYLAPHPTAPVLYAVSEASTHDDSGSGALVAYRIDVSTGALDEIDRVSSHGAGPCHLSLDAAASTIYCANYVGGSISAYGLEPDESFGELVARHSHAGRGPTSRQEAPHAHCMRPAPDGRSVHAVDLGTDEVIRYEHRPNGGGGRLVATSTLTTAAGAGPRHLAFHPSGVSALLVCELDNTAVLLRVAETGALEPIEVHPTRAAAASGESIAAAVAIDDTGRFAYVTNRGDDTVAVYRFDASATAIVPCGHVPTGGRTPRTVALHPSGQTLLVANQDSDNLVLFDLDETTGLPSQRLVSAHRFDAPTCLVMREVAS